MGWRAGGWFGVSAAPSPARYGGFNWSLTPISGESGACQILAPTANAGALQRRRPSHSKVLPAPPGTCCPATTASQAGRSAAKTPRTAKPPNHSFKIRLPAASCAIKVIANYPIKTVTRGIKHRFFYQQGQKQTRQAASKPTVMKASGD